MENSRLIGMDTIGIISAISLLMVPILILNAKKELPQ